MPVRKIDGHEMKSMNDTSKETGLSITMLRNYVERGLVSAYRTQQGQLTYMWFDETALFRLQLIKLFRELGVSLNEIQLAFDSPSFDQNELLNQLIVKLKKKKAEISRCIEFCELSKTIGIKALGPTASGMGGISAYMVQYQKLMQKNKELFANCLDDATFEANVSATLRRFPEVSHFPPTSDEAIAYLDDLIDDIERGMFGYMLGKGDVSDNGVRVLALVALIIIAFGKGDLAKWMQNTAGADALEYLPQAAFFQIFCTLDSICRHLRPTFFQCRTRKARNEYLSSLRHSLATWLSPFLMGTDIENDDDILEMIQDTLEWEDGDLRDPELVTEIYQELLNELNKFPL